MKLSISKSGKHPHRQPIRRGNCGFTLAEALLAVVILAFVASAMSGLYMSGLQALEGQGARAVLDSHLRSRMEELLSRHFSEITDGSNTVAVDGTSYTVTWTVSNADLDGDATPETEAKQVTVTLDGRSLSTLVVDTDAEIGKL